jgi:hypothetical protein
MFGLNCKRNILYGFGENHLVRSRKKNQSPYAASTLSLSRSSGLTEKNLCRQGAQRSAGIRSTRATRELIPGTYTGEILCNSAFPQMAQCAYSMLRQGTWRARNRVSQVSHRQGKTPATPYK